METLTERQIEVATRWWADALNEGHFDNGERGLANAFAGAMTSILHGRAGITPETTAAFARELGAILRAGSMEYQGRQFQTCGMISTDYHPDIFLGTALARADITDNKATLPWKTVMWFKDGGVQVAAGYGARAQWILSPTRVRVGQDAYRPATRYWSRRSERWRKRDGQERTRKHIMSYATLCRVCNSFEDAWWHGTAAKMDGRKEAHAYVARSGGWQWRVRRAATRAIRDGRENQFVRTFQERTWL